jgi:hypothetical protein
METPGPAWLTARVARNTSSTWVPATKRLDMRCPMAERSAIPRKERLSEREMKSALSTGNQTSRSRFENQEITCA